MAPSEYLGAWGTLIHEKNLRRKISCQTPFKQPGTYPQFYKDFPTMQNCQMVFLWTQFLRRILLFLQESDREITCIWFYRTNSLLNLEYYDPISAHQWSASDEPEMMIHRCFRPPKISSITKNGELADPEGRSPNDLIQSTNCSLWNRFDCCDYMLSSLADLAQPTATKFKGVVNLWTVWAKRAPLPTLWGSILYLNTTVCKALLK